MRTFRRSILALTLVLGIFAAAPTSAAPSKTPKKFESTIMVPLLDVGTWFGAGYGNWTQTGDDMAAVRQTCPTPGDYDGYTWRFFDLKGPHTQFLARGPEPLHTQDTPVGIFHDYDIDLWLFDAKCNRIDIDGANAGGGIEKMSSSKKPAHYAVIVYWYGVIPNIPITLEYGV